MHGDRFPNGNMTTKTKEFETKDAIENARPKDMVIISAGEG